MQQFLDTLYGEINGWVYSPTLDRSTEAFTQFFFQWPQQRYELLNHIQNTSASIEVYTAPALFKSPGTAQKDNVLGSNMVWCEFDGSTPTDLGPSLPEPSVRVQSSEKGHEHWYWSLSEFSSDVKHIEAINRGLTYQLGADSSGWDINQILRPPNSLNHKRGQLPVIVLSSQPLSYPLSSFAGLPEPPVQITEFTASDIFDPLDVVAKYAWSKKAWTFFRTRPPVGERSTALMQLGYLCAEMGMDDREIFSVLYNADERWDKFKGRLDRERRLCDIIIRARVKHPLRESNLQTLEVFGLQDLLNSEVTVEWTIQDLLQQNGSLLLTGPPGLGKSQISLHFAIHTVLGLGYLGYPPPTERQKIIYFSLEMTHAGLKYFLSQMVTHLTPQQLEILQRDLLLIPLGEALYLDQEQQQKLVESVIEKHDPTGIMIDSLGSTTPDELSSESTAKAILDWEAKVRNKHGVFVWWIHHNRKASTLNKTPNKLDDIYGNRYIGARPDSILCAWGRPGEETFKFITLKQRYAETIKPFTVKREGVFFIKTSTTNDEGVNAETFIASNPDSIVDYSEAEPGIAPDGPLQGGI